MGITYFYHQSKQRKRLSIFLNSSKNSWSSDNFDIQPNFNKYPDIGFPTSNEKAPINLGVILDGNFFSYFRKPPNQPDIDENDDSFFFGRQSDIKLGLKFKVNIGFFQ